MALTMDVVNDSSTDLTNIANAFSLEDLVANNSFIDSVNAKHLDQHDEDDMKGFIEIFGSKAFYQNYEDYLRMIDQYDQETVDAFLNADFDIDDISSLEDAYYGQYDSEEEFAENFVNECYGLPEMPTWIAIDWEKTWEDGLSWDYTFYNGYVFCNHY